MNVKHIVSVGVINSQPAARSFLQWCGGSRRIETLSLFAHGGGSFEMQVKKLLNDRKSEMDGIRGMNVRSEQSEQSGQSGWDGWDG